MFLILLSVIFPFVYGDLPIHATINHIKGKWKFLLSPHSAYHQTCGSGLPNRNHENLQKQFDNYEFWMNSTLGPINKELLLWLTDNKVIGYKEGERSIEFKGNGVPEVNNAYLIVKPINALNDSCNEEIMTKDNTGKWTMVYTEGFQVQFKDYNFFGFIDYEKSSDKDCENLMPKDTDSEDAYGVTHCYKTNHSKTRLGWYSVKMPDNKIHYGCFIAYKINTSQKAPHKVYVAIPKNNKRSMLQRYGSKRKTGWKTLQLYDRSTIGIIPEGYLYPCIEATPKSITAFPKNYSSILNPFSKNFSKEAWTDIIEQGECGSCYAISSTFVLQARANILLKKLLKKQNIKNNILLDTRLSAQSILSCSFYNQGCSGGYPFLVGRWAKEFGIPTEKCMDYKATDRAQLCHILQNKKNHCSEKTFIFAEEYGYVGGCYECCSEEAMMHEIYNNGPLVVAIDAPPVLSLYKNGIFVKQNNHTGSCEDPQLNGWEFTNHAVAVVGWGEEPNHDNPSEIIPYWIVRNSWGSQWGKSGYMKMLRGQNLAGIEAQAVYINADPNKGLLKQILLENQVQ